MFEACEAEYRDFAGFEQASNFKLRTSNLGGRLRRHHFFEGALMKFEL